MNINNLNLSQSLPCSKCGRVVEMKKLKGTLKPTKVKPPKKKIKRRSKDEIYLARHELKKAALKKAVKKQQDFLNHKINKG